ncbi:MAG: cbb3-type cytochrome oxidase assembly protein CcoS [Bdellovibrionales bacterium]|nr:cbb3-type cytochrome oxidase assembly protein CcoS [Bdellovibrionales bacterium]
MSLIIFMILLTFILVAVFLAAFLWAAKSGQFDDLTSPALRILRDHGDDRENEEREG